MGELGRGGAGESGGLGDRTAGSRQLAAGSEQETAEAKRRGDAWANGRRDGGQPAAGSEQETAEAKRRRGAACRWRGEPRTARRDRGGRFSLGNEEGRLPRSSPPPPGRSGSRAYWRSGPGMCCWCVSRRRRILRPPAVISARMRRPYSLFPRARRLQLCQG
jgi:hypothetical protein